VRNVPHDLQSKIHTLWGMGGGGGGQDKDFGRRGEAGGLQGWAR
jgi:hypothetical protein